MEKQGKSMPQQESIVQSEKPKLSEQQIVKMRKDLMDLRDKEIEKQKDYERDSDLVALPDIDIRNFGSEQLYPFERFLFYQKALEALGANQEDEHGDRDVGGLLEDMAHDIEKIKIQMGKQLDKRAGLFLEKEKRNMGPEFKMKYKTDEQYKAEFYRQDSFALYAQWIARQFGKLSEYGKYILAKEKKA